MHLLNVLLVVVCPNTTVANSKYVFSSYEGYPAGNRVLLICDHGFNVKGSQLIYERLTCQSNGTWNPPIPTCGKYMHLNYFQFEIFIMNTLRLLIVNFRHFSLLVDMNYSTFAF